MKYLFIGFIFFLTSCVTNTFNTPFINADETIQLNFGMSKEEVLAILNEPLFVAYGDNNQIIWVYEVRTIEVNSKSMSDGTIKLNKTSQKTKHATVLHQLALTFSDNELMKWEPYVQ